MNKDNLENSEVVFTPESILPEGVDSLVSVNPYTGEAGSTRKGTVASTLNNIALLNGLLFAEESLNNKMRLQKIIDGIISLIPSLRIIGVFDLFSIEEWLAADSQPGRILTAVFYLQKYPQDMTSEIKERLVQVQEKTTIKVLSEAIEEILVF